MNQVLPPPSDNWLHRLRRGHRVWLPKQACFAQIEWAWEPPEPGCVAGRIALRKINGDRLDSGCEIWFIYGNGRGFDGQLLMFPVDGHLPDDPPPLPEPWQRQVERTLDTLLDRVDKLEFLVSIVGFTPSNGE